MFFICSRGDLIVVDEVEAVGKRDVDEEVEKFGKFVTFVEAIDGVKACKFG